MNKRVIAVVVGTLLALIAATVWVPIRMTVGGTDQSALRDMVSDELRFRPVWRLQREQLLPFDLGGGDGRDLSEQPYSEPRIEWPIVFFEQALILLFGGGLLTFVVRRERRRKAMA